MLVSKEGRITLLGGPPGLSRLPSESLRALVLRYIESLQGSRSLLGSGSAFGPPVDCFCRVLSVRFPDKSRTPGATSHSGGGEIGVVG